MDERLKKQVDASRLDRRSFLRLAGLGGLVISTGGIAYLRNRNGLFNRTAQEFEPLDPRDPSNFNQPLLLPSDRGLLGIMEPSSPLTITARPIVQELLPGKPATVWAYEVIDGGKTFRNPILRVPKGGTIQALLKNGLREETIIHWHGLRIDTENDGHPHSAIPAGGTYSYKFNLINRAAPYWYHPHPHGRTAGQVYFGLTSFLIVEDEEEKELTRALDLELGTTDIPLLLQDRQFSADGSLFYFPRRNDFFMGVLGDVMLVNNTVKPFLDVSSRVYRFRILNGSNSRNYRLAFLKGSERMPFYIIGNDGGLVDKPYPATEVTISVAERLDLLLDLRNALIGDTIFLKSLGVDLTAMAKSMGEMHSSDLGSEQEFYVLKLNVKNRLNYDKVIPSRLSDIVPIDIRGVDTRRFTLANSSSTQWTINGLKFQMDEYPVIVNRRSVEIWEVNNIPASMPHPMHLHGYQFQVLERMNSPKQVRNQAVDERGLIPTDKGWKDTVLVWPGETVRFAIDFSNNFPGDQIYLFHCHILEHEDGGMMINYKVV